MFACFYIIAPRFNIAVALVARGAYSFTIAAAIVTAYIISCAISDCQMISTAVTF